jgi:hypothetical protein
LEAVYTVSEAFPPGRGASRSNELGELPHPGELKGRSWVPILHTGHRPAADLAPAVTFGDAKNGATRRHNAPQKGGHLQPHACDACNPALRPISAARKSVTGDGLGWNSCQQTTAD